VTLRIGYLTGEYPRATDTFIQREVAALRALGHHVQTFSVRRPVHSEITDETVARERDGTHYLLPPRSAPILPANYLNAMRAWMGVVPKNLPGILKHSAYFVEAALLAGQMRRRNLTHLHNHFSDSSCTVAMLAAILGGFTFSFTLHGPADFVMPGYWRLDEKIRRAKFVVCISEFARRQTLRFTPEGMENKLHIVHCGVDMNDFPPAERRESGHQLLFIGRLAAAKGLSILLEAVADGRKTLPDIKLTIVGDGPERASLENLAADLNLNTAVKFLGYQSQPQIRALLKQSDIFVMTSLAEGVPVVLMEAMAAGVPVIAPRIAGIPELIDDQVTGLLTPPGDPAATAGAILKILTDENLQRRFTQNARVKIERDFNLRTEAKHLESLFVEWAPPTNFTGGEQCPPYKSQSSVLSPQAYLLITPCRDEAKYLQRTIDSVANQTILPARWIIVDDGSADQTADLLAEYAARFAWIKIIRRSDRGFRQLGGGVIDAFYTGYDSIDPSGYHYIAKLDLDIQLPPRYFESLIQRMEDEPRLGTASGKPYYLHPTTGRRTFETCGDEQSVGMAKFYRTACFRQIGGFVRELMWDGIDGHRCRQHGWLAASYNDPQLNFEHLRPMGTSDKSWWTGRMRHGVGQYFMGTSLPYLLASCVYRLMQPPAVIGSIAMLSGYVKSMIVRRPRYGDEEFRCFLREYQWACLVKGKSVATAELNGRQASTWQPTAGGANSAVCGKSAPNSSAPLSH
jgi:glycosyltransferase involved in cell wall biosynthesis